MQCLSEPRDGALDPRLQYHGVEGRCHHRTPHRPFALLDHPQMELRVDPGLVNERRRDPQEKVVPSLVGEGERAASCGEDSEMAPHDRTGDLGATLRVSAFPFFCVLLLRLGQAGNF